MDGYYKNGYVYEFFQNDREKGIIDYWEYYPLLDDTIAPDEEGYILVELIPKTIKDTSSPFQRGKPFWANPIIPFERIK